MGKLYKRGDTYYADYFDRQGRRQRQSTHTSDQQVAKQRLRDLELATTDRAAPSTETLDAALTYFLKVVCAGKAEGTRDSYGKKARHVSRLLGATLLDRLDRETIERYIADRLGEEAATHSVHKELVVLRGALTSASERGRTSTLPSVVPQFSAGYTPRTTYLTPDQFMRLTDFLVPPIPVKARAQTLADREERRTKRALYCLLIALASPRRGELEALDWTDVDLGRGVIRVPKGKTKSRPVAIHPVLRPWLEALDRGSGPVVDPWANVCRDIPRACERAGVPRCTPNDLRRTFASWLVQDGVSLLVVSRLLGHSSTRMVDLVYGQLDEATLFAAIQRLPGGSDDVRRYEAAREVLDDGHPGTQHGVLAVDGNDGPRVRARSQRDGADGVGAPDDGASATRPDPRRYRDRPSVQDEVLREPRTPRAGDPRGERSASGAVPTADAGSLPPRARSRRRQRDAVAGAVAVPPVSCAGVGADEAARSASCAAGVTRVVPNRGTGGAGGTSPASPAIRNSVEESANSGSSFVPRDGVEPPTRGFSVPFSPAEKVSEVATLRPKLRVVR